MENYLIGNFKTGNVVYYRRNKDQRMIIERIDKNRNEIICGWIDEKGKVLSRTFKPLELGNVS